MGMEKFSLREGDEAPDFELNDHTGNKIFLHHLKGKNVVLYFYPKDFTPGCTTEALEFTKNYELFAKKDIEIIGISPDDGTSHNKFRLHMGIPYLLVSDVDHKIAEKYGVWGIKKFMGKEYEGVIRSTFLINKNGRIMKIFKKVKPLGHSEETLKCFN